MPAWDSLHPLMEKFRHRRWRKLSTRRCKEGHIKTGWANPQKFKCSIRGNSRLVFPAMRKNVLNFRKYENDHFANYNYSNYN